MIFLPLCIKIQTIIQMMSLNVAKWCHQMLYCCIATTVCVVLEPVICEDLDLHVAIFPIFIFGLKIGHQTSNATDTRSCLSLKIKVQRHKSKWTNGPFTPAIFSTIAWTLTFCVNDFCVHTCFVLYYFGHDCVVWLSQISLWLHVLNSALNAVTCLCYCLYCVGIKMSAWYRL